MSCVACRYSSNLKRVAWPPVLTTALTKLACRLAPERALAKVFVAKDLSNLGVRTKTCAALVDNYATTADALKRGQGRSPRLR